jgi:hypothetical protein
MNIYKPSVSFILLLFLTGCLSNSPLKNRNNRPIFESSSQPTSQSSIMLAAERKATPQGRKILATGRQMTVVDKEIIPGGCWDYANEVYNRAGYPNQRKKRRTIFKGSKEKGPYANISLIQPGDFLYYINHSYGDIEHSAIFVDWVNSQTKQALMLSYGGESRQEPARYLSYDLSHVYRIIRATN